MNVQAKPRERAEWVAVGCMLLSGLLYTLGYSLSKLLVDSYAMTALQVTFLRYALVFAASLACLPWRRSGVTWGRLLRPPRAWEQRISAAALVGSSALAVLSYGLMPVTAATALGFTAPLLLTAMAGLVLREHVSPGRWTGAVLGFAGVLLIVNPAASPAALGIAAAGGGALVYAIYQVLVRRLRAVVTSVDITLQAGLVGTVMLAGAMAVSWRPMGWAAWGLVVVATALQTAGLACLAVALRRSEASRLAPWQYSGLLWAMALDAAMFGAAPSATAFAGGALIVAGGVLAHRWGGRGVRRAVAATGRLP